MGSGPMPVPPVRESKPPLIDWRVARRLQDIPFFTYTPFVVISVPLLAALYLSFKNLPQHWSFPRALATGFAASMFFVFSRALFHGSCPKIVQKYESPEEFATETESFEQDTYRHLKPEFVATHIDE